MTYPLVSIIIPNYNGKKFLKNCISSILRQNYPKKKTEIIVVDDASTDGSVEYIKKEFPMVKLFALKKNLGYVKVNNFAYKKARGKYVILVNNDTKFPKNWLKSLVETAEKDEKTAAVSSMVFHSGDKLDEKNGEKINLSPVCIGRSDPNKDNPITLFPSSESCLLRKNVFDKPFDPDYIIYHDCVWTGWNAWLRGYKVLFEKKSKFWHIGFTTYGFFTERQVYLSERNRFMNILSFMKVATILLFSPMLILDFLFRIFYFLFSLKFKQIKSEFNAIFWNIKNIKKILQKRKRIQKMRKVEDYIILESFCEHTYGKGGLIKKILNLVFMKYFRFVKKICRFFNI